MKFSSIIDVGAGKWRVTKEHVIRGTRKKAVFKQGREGKVFFMVKSHSNNIGELRSEICASRIGKAFGFSVQKVWLCTAPQYSRLGLASDLGVLIQLDVRKQKVKKYKKVREDLIHASALIDKVDKSFSIKQLTSRRNAYTLDIVVRALRNYAREKEAPEIWEQFFELMAFDALIGGTDRHDNNWAVLEKASTHQFLKISPAFDNGISLLWNTEHHGPMFQRSAFTDAFVKGAKSALRRPDGYSKYSLYEVLQELYTLPEYRGSNVAKRILDRIARVKPRNIRRSFASIPNDRRFGISRATLGLVDAYLQRRLAILKQVLARLH
jgi:GNAT superfamily N-acetyltransferase